MKVIAKNLASDIPPLDLSSSLIGYFFKGCHHAGVSLIYWAPGASLTCKTNLLTAHTSLTWIDIVWTNHKMERRSYSEKSSLAPSFEPATCKPRSSLLLGRTFLTVFGHFCSSTRSNPIDCLNLVWHFCATHVPLSVTCLMISKTYATLSELDNSCLITFKQLFQ